MKCEQKTASIEFRKNALGSPEQNAKEFMLRRVARMFDNIEITADGIYLRKTTKPCEECKKA